MTFKKTSAGVYHWRMPKIFFAKMGKPNAKINGAKSSNKVDDCLLSAYFDANKRYTKLFEGDRFLFEELTVRVL